MRGFGGVGGDGEYVRVSRYFTFFVLSEVRAFFSWAPAGLELSLLVS